MSTNFNLTALNTSQLEAAMHTEGPCMIIAGPGAGKTRVLTYRVAYLIQEKQVFPSRILVLTFTNKAAKEIRARAEALIGASIRGLWMGTFHSLFARLLRREAATLGFPSHFSIYDREDSKSLLKKILKELNLSTEQYPLNSIIHRIAQAKNKLLDGTLYGQSEWVEEDKKRNMPHLAQIFAQYMARCQSAQAMDFDDLLLNTYRLLSKYPDICAKYQEYFHYILVDEFQDTNKLQYEILQLLAKKHQNLCIIGDDAQSIYAFRGAEVENMLSFKSKFPAAHIVKLQQNYRSTQHIVQVANKLISRNKQYQKKLFTENEQGEKISIHTLYNELEEAQFVARDLLSRSLQKQVAYDQFAILYRSNQQSRLLEEGLRRQNIPYRVLGGLSFYQRKEIKDLLAYLYLLVNSNNEEALQRAINQPKRGIGVATLAKVRKYATTNNMGVWEALSSVNRYMKGKVANAIGKFVKLIEDHKERLSDESAFVVAGSILKESGLATQLYQDKTVEGVSRYENIQEFLGGIAKFVEENTEDNSLATFLEEIALFTNLDSEEEADQAKVLLMTVHGAKGLEFSYVYIVGMEQTIFPTWRASHSLTELEEERRLFFVAITRAKKCLTITHTKNRSKYGKIQSSHPSQFLKELDSSCVYIASQHRIKPRRSQTQVSSQSQKRPIPFEPKKLANIHRLASTKDDISLDDWKVGGLVKHEKFGKGKIFALSTATSHPKVVVDFEREGKKTLLLKYAKLTRL